MNLWRVIFNRAAWRLVRRGLLRNKGRTFALFMLTLLPVLAAGAVTVGLASENNQFSVDRNFGAADARISLSGEALADRFPDAETATWKEFGIAFGETNWLVADAPLEDPLLAGYGDTLEAAWNERLAEGRWPTADGEVALNQDEAEVFGPAVNLGSVINFGEIELRVVGLLKSVEANRSLLILNNGVLGDGSANDVAVEIVGENLSDTETLGGVTLLRSDGLSEQEVIQFGSLRDGDVGDFNDDVSAPTVAALFTLGLSIATGAIAYAAWGSSTRRRLRDVGLLVSSGGDSAQAAVVQAGQGFIISLVAALTAIVAVVVSFDFFGVVVTNAQPFGSYAISILVAVVVATAAAWWPAFRAAKAPLGSVLNGRVPRPQAKPGFSIAGALGIAVGLALLGGASGATSATILLATGAIGVMLIAVGVVPLLSQLFQVGGGDRIGSEVPPNLRLVLRSLSRHAARSAAATLGIGAVVAVIWLGAVDDVQENRRQDTYAVGDSQTAEPFDGLIDEAGNVIYDATTSIAIAGPDSQVRRDLASQVLQATGAEQLTSLFAYSTPGFGPVLILGDGPAEANDLESAQLGFVGNRRAFAIDAPRPSWTRVAVDDVEVVNADGAVGALGELAGHSAIIVPGSEQPAPITVVQGLLLGGILIGALVMAFVMFIVSGEVEPELRTLSLLGTSSRFRQRFLATQAFLLTGTGVVAGLVVGTLIRLTVDSGLPIPVQVLVALGAMPPVFALGTYLLSWRPRQKATSRSDLVVAV